MTILRPGQFASNVLDWKQMVAAGTVAAPFGDVAIPVIDPLDVAEVALLALTDDHHRGKVYELSGSELLSSRQQVELLGEAVGRSLTFEDQDAAAFREANPWLPQQWVDYVLAVKGSPTAEEKRVRPTFETLTGRPARTFKDWVARNPSMTERAEGAGGTLEE